MFSLGPPPDRITGSLPGPRRKSNQVLLQKPLSRAGPWGPSLIWPWTCAEKLGFGDAFLGTPGRKVRFVAHGLGLEINEPPMYCPRGAPRCCVEGMTVALELKMVFPGLGAAGLENTVVVWASGPEKLTLAREDLVVI